MLGLVQLLILAEILHCTRTEGAAQTKMLAKRLQVGWGISVDQTNITLGRLLVRGFVEWIYVGESIKYVDRDANRAVLKKALDMMRKTVILLQGALGELEKLDD